MKLWLPRLLTGILSLFILLSCDNTPPKKKTLNRQQALSIITEWSGISEFPVPIKDLQIEETGNMMTRGFLVTIMISKESITEWIKTIPQLNTVTPKVYSNDIEEYNIQMKNPNKFGTLLIFPHDNKMTLSVSHS